MIIHQQHTTILLVMWMASRNIGLVSSSIKYTRETMPGAQYYDGKKLNIPISDEAAIELSERWIHQGISSIMSCIATQYLDKLNEYERNRIQKCSKAAQDIYEQARCVVRAIDAKPKQVDPTKFSHLQKLQKLLDGRRIKIIGAFVQHESRNIDVEKQVGTEEVEFRTRRSVINRHNYKLHTEYEHLTPFGILGKYLSKMTRVIKNKHPNMSWKKMMYDIESMKRWEQQKNDVAEQLKRRFSLNQIPEKMQPKLTADEKRLAKELHIPSHLLQGLDKNNVKTKKTLEIVRLLQRAVKLAMVLNGANGTELEDKTLRLGSPRLLSIVPDDAQDQISVLSPSLFSMHDKGKGLEALTSIPRLLNIVGSKDYEEWLNFIVEASGTTDAINELKEKQESDWLPPGYKTMPRGIDGQPMYFTKENVTEIDPEMARKMDVFENLTNSLTSRQIAEFNKKGFAMMNPEQLMLVYGPQSPLNDSKSLKYFLSLSEDEMHRHLVTDIRNLAKIRSSPKVRQKRQQVLAPSFGTANIFSPGGAPSILSPSAVSLSLFSPSIFGVAVLSSATFLATVLSPFLMSPAVLSPVALSSLVLSPVALSPAILSPGALTPSILSPNLLSPGVASPSVLSPLILSPFALNPFLLSPSALTAAVVSPFAMSPSFYSPNYISALVLSPYAFSPLFNSTGKAVTLLFSPSVAS